MTTGQSTTVWRIRRATASALLALGGLGLAVAAPAGAAAAEPVAPGAVADAAPAIAATPATTTVCDDGHWPTTVQGRPRFAAGSPAGDYLWHDARGWHLRVTHVGSRRVVFSGTISADQPITVNGVLLEKNDHFTLSADKLSLSYRFVNYGRIDGLNFRTACASSVTFLGKVAGHDLGVRRIWIGHHRRHPLKNPFTISRVV